MVVTVSTAVDEGFGRIVTGGWHAMGNTPSRAISTPCTCNQKKRKSDGELET
jgi:hypothetical protein